MIHLRHIPNVITVMRLILVGPFLWFLLHGDYQPAFLCFLMAGLSDGLDGYLARKYHWESHFGSFMDPLADKLLMISTFFALAYLGELSIGLVCVVIARDFIIMGGVAAYFYFIEEPAFEPTTLSKWTTALQIGLVVTILFELAFQTLPEGLLDSLQAIVVVLTVVSLLHYMFIYTRRAWQAKQQGATKRIGTDRG